MAWLSHPVFFVQDRINLGDLRERHVLFHTREAAAILYEVCSQLNLAEEEGRPRDAPTLDRLWVTREGELIFDGGPAGLNSDPMPVLASLVEQVLPPPLRGQPEYGVPGSLRVLAPRARGWPPGLPRINTAGELAAALRRYRAGSDASILQELFARSASPPAPLTPESPAPTVEPVAPLDVDELRLRLPIDDLEDSVPVVLGGDDAGRSPRTVEGRGLRRYARTSILVLALILLAFAAGYQVTRRIVWRSPLPTPVATPETKHETPVTPATRAGRDRGSSESDAIAVPAPAPLNIPATAGPLFSPSFAARGSSLLFHAGRDPAARLMMTDLRGAAAIDTVTLVEGDARNYHARLSPDGQRLAFDSDRDGVRGVYVENRDGSDLHRISGPGFAAVPTWAPDMRWLTLVRSEPAHERVWNLWLHDLSTGVERPLTAHKYGQTWTGSWFPDSRRLCYSHEDRLIVLDIQSHRTQEFRSPVAGRLVRTPAVSPDGRWIAFQVSRNGVWLLEVESGAMRRILDDTTAEEFAWDPRGGRLAYHSRRTGVWQIWLATIPDAAIVGP